EGVAPVVGCGRVCVVDCMRQCCEPATRAGGRTRKRNCNSRGTGSRTLAIGAPTSYGKRAHGTCGRCRGTDTRGMARRACPPLRPAKYSPPQRYLPRRSCCLVHDCNFLFDGNFIWPCADYFVIPAITQRVSCAEWHPGKRGKKSRAAAASLSNTRTGDGAGAADWRGTSCAKFFSSHIDSAGIQFPWSSRGTYCPPREGVSEWR